MVEIIKYRGLQQIENIITNDAFIIPFLPEPQKVVVFRTTLPDWNRAVVYTLRHT